MAVTQRDSRAETERRDERESDGTEALTPNEEFILLRNERRRAVLRRLRADPETTLGELSEYIAATESDTTVDELGSEDRKRVYISLYRTHLPMLAEAGVVEYDRDRGEVRRRPAADWLDRRLDRSDAARDGSGAGPVQYAAVASGLVAVAGAAGVPPLAAVDPVWWAVTSVATLGVLTAAHVRAER